MTVGIVLITHGQLAAQLLDIAENILCQRIAPVTRVEVPANISPQVLGEYADRVRDTMAAANAGSGVLVLTDIRGATPDNLARHFSEQCDARVVSGVNLPMLLRVLNYREQSLQQLCDTASSGGQSGIQQGDNWQGEA